MLPRYNSQENQIERSLLPKVDENQSAQTRNLPITGTRCQPLVNTNIVNFDLEHTYEIVSNSLESYINYRKLNRCKALGNFLDYREKIYKREKLGPFATKQIIPEIPLKQSTELSEKDTHQSPPTNPSTESMISEKSSPIKFIHQESSSPSVTEDTIIPIPSANLLRKPPFKQKRLTIPMKTKNNLKQIRSVNQDHRSKSPKLRKQSCILL